MHPAVCLLLAVAFLVAHVPAVTACGGAPPSPKCQAVMDAWCGAESACAPALQPRGCNTTVLPARCDTDEHGGADQWRCYSPSALTPGLSHYDTTKNSSCYCSRDEQLRAVLAECNTPTTAAGTDVFVAGLDSPFYGCFRIPALVRLGDSLLAFAEGRHPECADHAWNDIVVKRSTDGGRSWGGHTVQVVYGESHSTKFVTIGNPAPVYDAVHDTLLLPCCRNNKDVLLLRSTNGGVSWGGPTDLSANVTHSNWTFVATGPPGGLQLPSGRIVVPADHTAAGSTTNSHAMISDDYGTSWRLSNFVPNGNECQAAPLANGSLLLSMRTPKAQRQWALSNDNGTTWGPPTAQPLISETVCEASIVALPHFPGGPLLVLSSSFAATRANMTLHVSRDQGATFTPVVNVYPGSSAYSSLVALNDTAVGLLYERDNYAKLTYIAVDLAHHV